VLVIGNKKGTGVNADPLVASPETFSLLRSDDH